MNWFEIKGHWLHVNDIRIRLPSVTSYEPINKFRVNIRCQGHIVGANLESIPQGADLGDLIDALDEYFKNN
jgi:hypothetical protein